MPYFDQEVYMFDSLDEELKRSNQTSSTTAERCVLYACIVVFSVMVFVGLYAGIRFLD